MMSNSAASRSPHIHSSIATILNCEPSFDDSCEYSSLIDASNLEILGSRTGTGFNVNASTRKPISTRLLVDLAYACDNALYGNKTVVDSKSLQRLAAMGEQGDCKVVAATMLALNRLESAIRQRTGYAAGRAPLLKHMVSQVDNDAMAAILMTLLLPSGLNLRNLIWHGFVASGLPRRWLSLVLVLTYNLERELDTSEALPPTYNQSTMLEMLKLPCICDLQRCKRRDAESLQVLRAWLPKSHHDLLKLAFCWKRTRPASSIALMSIILEHGLRLDWCRLNDSPENAIARPGEFYVTLDGHGQKHKHDLILHPFVCSSHGVGKQNRLIPHLGGSTVALLTDLYASSSGGPNLRASLAHGLLDVQLELELMTQDTKRKEDYVALVAVADIVVAAMEGAALCPKPELSAYCPQFSYRAAALRNLETVVLQLDRLVSMRDSMTCARQIKNDHLATLMVPSLFDTIVTNMQNALRVSNASWKATHVFEEHKINVALVEFGASRTLLADLAVATSSIAYTVEEALSELRNDDIDKHKTLCSRQRRRLERICSVSDVAIAMYRFAELVAVQSLSQAYLQESTEVCYATTVPPEVMLKAVERTRMCVSTFSNFLTANTDRALKAAADYTKGKAVKAVLLCSQPCATD